MSDENQNQTNGEPEESEIAASALDLPLNGREAKAVANDAGLSYVNGETIRRLSKLGVDADSHGLVSVAAGGIITTMEGLIEMQNRVLDVARNAKKVSDVLFAAQAFAMLAKSTRDCATAVRADGLAGGVKPQKKTKRVFQVLAPPAAAPKVG